MCQHESQAYMISWVRCLPLFIWIKPASQSKFQASQSGGPSGCYSQPQHGGWSHNAVHKAAPFQGQRKADSLRKGCEGKDDWHLLPQRHSFFMVPHAPVFVLGQVPTHHSRRQRSAQRWMHRGNNQLWDCLGSVSNKTLHHMAVCYSACVRSQKALFWLLVVL